MKQPTLYLFVLIIMTSNTVFGQHYWERYNPGGGGAFSSVVQNYNGDIYVASDLSGIYKSTNNGQNWNVLGSEQGLQETHIATFGFVEDNPDIVMISSGWGIYKSTNGGNTIYNVLDNGYIEDTELAPSNPNIGYAAYHEDYDLFGEIYKTTDMGENWQAMSTNLPTDLRILKIVISNNDPNTLYILSGQGRFACSEAKLFKSTDGGSNWVEKGVNYPSIIDFVIAPNDDETLYITNLTADCGNEYYFIDEVDDGGFYKSTDGGDSFELVIERTGIIWLNKDNAQNIRLIDPRFVYDWNDEYGTWATMDGGQNWTRIGTWDDLHIGWSPSQYYRYNLGFNGFTKSVVPSLSSSQNIFWANAQFIYGSFDGGMTFDNICTNGSEVEGWTSTGCDNIVGHAIETSKTEPEIVYMGGYDIGLWRSDNGGQSWHNANPFGTNYVWGGDGGSNTNTIVADPERDGVVWANFQEATDTQGALLKSTDYGSNYTWVNANTGLENKIILHGLSLDTSSPTTNRTLYITADGDVYKSINDGLSWTMILANGGLRFTSINPINTNIIYAGGENGLYQSMDNGANWSNISINGMTGDVNDDIIAYNWKGVFDIVCDPTDEQTVYVTVYGQDGGLYKSIDNGLTWENKYSNDYLRALAIHPQFNDVLYLTSSTNYYSGGYSSDSKGVLYSTDGGENWIEQNENLPWLNAAKIKIDNNSPHNLYAWSPGVGIIKSSVSLVVNNTSILNNKRIIISPNPATNYLHIEGIKAGTDITIFNLLGQKVLIQTGIPTSAYKLDISSLEKGVYILKTKKDTHIENYKFTKL